MDNQDHRKIDHVSGHDSYGVHLCPKCLWPFPNPHPSAKHRRAHKRVCGTIEGYRLVDSGETNHGAASDDDHLSDEDHKTPIPRVLGGNNVENIAGIEAVSNRSEVFSDAAAEFQDGGFIPGRLNSRENPSNPADKVSGKDLSPNLSFNDCANTDIIQRSQETRTLSGRILEYHDHASSSKEPVDMLIDDSNVLRCNLQHIKLETSADVSEDSKNITTSVGTTECSMFVGQETDARANKELNVGLNFLDDVNSPIKLAGETSEQASKSEKSLKIESDTVLTDGVVQLEEDLQETDGKGNPGTNMEGNLMGAAISQSKDVNLTYDTVLNAEKKEEVTPPIELADEIIQVEGVPQRVLASKVAAGDLSPKAEPTEHISASLDTAYNKVDATQTTDEIIQVEEVPQIVLASNVVEGEFFPKAEPTEHINASLDTAHNKVDATQTTDEIIQVEEAPQVVLASNVAAFDFSQEAEPTEHINASLDTAHNKVDATQTTDFLNSNEDYEQKGYAVGSAHLLSVPGEIPIVDHAEMMLEDFKDQKKVHIYQSVPLASGEINKDREDEIQDSPSESRNLREGVDVSASDVHVLEGSSKLEDLNNKPMVEEEVSGEDVLQVNVGSDKIGGSVTTENEIDQKVCSPEKQQLNDTCDDLRQPAYSGTATRIFSDTNPSVASVDSEVNQIANIVSSNNDAEHEETETGGCNIAYNDRKVDIEHGIESMINSFESARNLSKHFNPLSGLLEDNNAGDHGKGETENFDINQVESVEDVSMKTNSKSELTSSYQENQVVLEDVNDDCQRKLGETDSMRVDEVLKFPEEIKEHEMNGTGEIQGDCSAEFSLAIESDNGGGPDFHKNSEGPTKTGLPSEGQTEKEVPSFPLDVEATIQCLSPAENNNTRESGEASYGVGSHSLHEEAGNSFVKHQLDTTAVDASVESSSQTDSLEANCGSVSALSTVSDIPTGIDSDALPSADSQPPAEAEKGDAKKPIGASDKSDLFEPPAFLTLIEPGGSGQTVAALEMQTGKNPEKLKATADASVESSSRTDSLEGNWGSVSVLSTVSDIPIGIDSDALPSTDSQPPAEAEKGVVKKPNGASDKSDLFDPPSFMTLIEPGGSGRTVAASEMQTGKNPEQLKATAMQAGWFPSLPHTSNESQGRKKNEEIIAKVTNWKVKQNTPPKNLLGAANFENKPKSPNPKDNPYTVIQRDEKLLKDNGSSAIKESSVQGHEAPVGKSANTEAAKGWASPARYPVDDKREKRKVKGRPYWVQFVCCSSVN